MALVRTASSLVASVASAVVLVLTGIVAFYVTVFVVSTGAALAGYEPSGDFVVLAAALLVVAALLAGGVSAAGSSAGAPVPETARDDTGFQ
ncbi:MAG: hypothetical protein ABEJ70_09330 [Halobacteriaceae archaeon]